VQRDGDGRKNQHEHDTGTDQGGRIGWQHHAVVQTDLR
jgi:hypothetical protein